MPGPTRKEQLQAMLVEDASDPFLRYAYAMEIESDGDTDGAIAQLELLLKDSPEYVPGFLQAGQLLVKTGRVDEAKEMLRMGMQTAFKQADHHAYEEMEGLLSSLN